MAAQAYLMGIDIGATSVKAAAFDHQGTMHASASAPNTPSPQPDAPAEWRIWDLEAMWASICDCTQKVMTQIGAQSKIEGVAVSGFGTDGIPMTRDGRMLYPCISWHCSRTAITKDQVNDKLGADRIYQTTGYHNYPINALNRLVWMQQNAPEALEHADIWVSVQDYIVYRLTGEFATDRTYASTTMCLDIRKREWANDLLSEAGVDPNLMGPLLESGSAVGQVDERGSKQSGVPLGTTVATGGHDTELAIIGAGVNDNETFLDINGTWEILMALTEDCQPNQESFSHGLDWECHAQAGWWNAQALMIAGGAIEWVRDLFFAQNGYDQMIADAQNTPPGAHHIYLLPAFVRGMGPAQAHDPLGTVLGIDTKTTRGDIARATFEGLSFQFYQQICALENCLNTKAKSVRVTGGGQKNPFWMQMKADVAGRALDVLQNVESTLLGAAVLAGIGGGAYQSIEDALKQINIPVETIEPDEKRHAQYQEHYQQVVSKIPPQLEPVYQTIHGYWDAR